MIKLQLALHGHLSRIHVAASCSSEGTLLLSSGFATSLPIPWPSVFHIRIPLHISTMRWDASYLFVFILSTLTSAVCGDEWQPPISGSFTYPLGAAISTSIAPPPLPRDQVCLYLTNGRNWTGVGINLCNQPGICSEMSSESVLWYFRLTPSRWQHTRFTVLEHNIRRAISESNVLLIHWPELLRRNLSADRVPWIC